MTGFFSTSEAQSEKPIGLVPKCGACGLYQGCHSPKIEVQGHGKRGILIVGEAPAKSDDRSGDLFTDDGGCFLRDTVESFGFDLDEDTYYTNALICHTKSPTFKQAGFCQPNLANTLVRLQPRVVIVLGRLPLVSLLGSYWKSDVGVMERWVGWRIPAPNFWICPAYHPNFLLWSKNQVLDRLFAQHLKRAFAIEVRPPEQLDYRSRIELLYEVDEIESAIEEMGASEWSAFDYEGNCLKPEYPQSRIYSCAISNGKRTVSFPMLPELKPALIRYYQSRSQKIASNLKFEERWTKAKFGCRVQNWGWDTMLAAHCLDNRPGITSLKFQAFVKLGVPTYNEQIEPYLKSVNGFYNRIQQIPIADLLYYGGLDALLEYRLAMRQRKEMGCE